MAAKDTMDKSTAPIIIDMGKKSSVKVKKLRKGEGSLLEDIQAAIKELQTAGKVSSTAQPVVVVVSEKEKFAWW